MATVSKPRGSKLEMEAKRREIIRLRYEGNTLERTAELVGLAGPSSVQHHEQAWLAERTPSAEVTEHRRQLQLEGIDSLRARLFAALDDDDGRPRVEVVDRINRLWEREAKLVGLDLQLGVTVNVLTRESLADVLYADEPVIEGVAVEIEANTDA